MNQHIVDQEDPRNNYGQDKGFALCGAPITRTEYGRWDASIVNGLIEGMPDEIIAPWTCETCLERRVFHELTKVL